MKSINDDGQTWKPFEKYTTGREKTSSRNECVSFHQPFSVDDYAFDGAHYQRLPSEVIAQCIGKFLDRSSVNKLSLTCKSIQRIIQASSIAPWPTSILSTIDRRGIPDDGGYLHPPIHHEVKRVFFSPNSEFLACTTTSDSIYLWSRLHGPLPPIQDSDMEVVSNAIFSPDSTRLAHTALVDAMWTICVWSIHMLDCSHHAGTDSTETTTNTDTNNNHNQNTIVRYERIHILPNDHDVYNFDGLAFIDDYNIAFVNDYNVIKVWNLLQGHCHQVLACHAGEDDERPFNIYLPLLFSSRTNMLVSAISSSEFAFFQKTSNKENMIAFTRISKLVTTKHIVSFTLSPNGRRLACGYKDGSFEIYDCQTYPPTLRISLRSNRQLRAANAVSFSADGTKLASYYVNFAFSWKVCVWNVRTGEILTTYDGTGPVFAPTICHKRSLAFATVAGIRLVSY